MHLPGIRATSSQPGQRGVYFFFIKRLWWYGFKIQRLDERIGKILPKHASRSRIKRTMRERRRAKWYVQTTALDGGGHRHKPDQGFEYACAEQGSKHQKSGKQRRHPIKIRGQNTKSPAKHCVTSKSPVWRHSLLTQFVRTERSRQTLNWLIAVSRVCKGPPDPSTAVWSVTSD